MPRPSTEWALHLTVVGRATYSRRAEPSPVLGTAAQLRRAPADHPDVTIVHLEEARRRREARLAAAAEAVQAADALYDELAVDAAPQPPHPVSGTPDDGTSAA